MNFRKYEVWHDESKIGGYHHGILLIPIDKKEKIISLIKEIRKEYKIPNDFDLKFAGSLNSDGQSRIISNMLSLFSQVIKSKNIDSTKIYNIKSKRWHKEDTRHYLEINELFDCKFVLLRIKDNMESMYFDTYAKKVEKTFNFVLKSCCHGMFSKENPIEISKFYFDGDEHHGGYINLNTIISGSLREYVKISSSIEIDSRQMKERDDETKIIMNFVDNVVGAWRAILNNESDPHKTLFPLNEILERIMDGRIFSNKYSKWHKSISLSDFTIEQGKIDFPYIFRCPDQGRLLG